jgi:hypothetical protein
VEKTLEKKLQQKNPTFEDSEVDWMLENIGVEDPKVRDELIYSLLTRAIYDEYLTEAQFLRVAGDLLKNNLVFYKMDEEFPAVLTRSFAALQCGNVLSADGQKGGRYYHQLSNTEREQFFQDAIAYLQEEPCSEGYSDTYGWIHAFAHGADFLRAAMTHPDFPPVLAEQVLYTLEYVFCNIGGAFTAGEERRLGRVVVSGILSGKLTQSQVADWLKQVNFPLRENLDYVRLATFEVFLAYIYFHLFEKIELEGTFKSALLEYLREI